MVGGAAGGAVGALVRAAATCVRTATDARYTSTVGRNVPNDVHFIRREVAHSQEDRPGAIGCAHVSLGARAIVGQLDDIADHAYDRLAVVRSGIGCCVIQLLGC